MSEDSYLLEPKNKKKKTPYEWFMLLLKVTFFICAFTLVIMTILANMGGNGKTWHEGVRNFISEFAGGRPVKLGKLNDMNFFPTVRLDIEDVEILTKPDDHAPIINLDKLLIGMPFMDVATRSPRIREFYVEGLSTIKGVFMPKEFYLDKLFIDHDQISSKATLRANGKIGLQAWSFEAGMEVQKGITGKNSYVLAPKSPFAFDFADIHFKGIYNHVSSSHLKIENLELRSGNKIVTGNIIFSNLDNNLVKLQGTLDIQNGRTIISPDFIIDSSHKDGNPTKISGEIKSEKLVIKDIIGKESIFKILTRMHELMGYKIDEHNAQAPLSFLNTSELNLHIFLQNVEDENASYEALSFDVLKENGNIRIDTITGKDDRKLMPPLMLLQKPDSKDLAFIMQAGKLDVGFLHHWLKNIPKDLINKQTVLLHCAIGDIAEDNKNWTITSKKPVFALSDNIALQNMELSKEQYDFVQAGLQKSAKLSPCARYISLREPEQKSSEQKISEE